MNLIKYNSLLTFCENILSEIGLDDFSMKSVSKGLCESSLRGVDSHGIRLLPHYVESAIKGRKNPRPKFKLNLSFATCGVLDADNGFGHAAGFKAIEHCIKIAEKINKSVWSIYPIIETLNKNKLIILKDNPSKK